MDRFIEVEDQNFSLFNYVNELNNEIEMLQEKACRIAARRPAHGRSDCQQQERH